LNAYAYRAVLVDYDEDLFTPPPWIPAELARDGIGWVQGQWRTPEAALDAAQDADVVLVQSLRPLLAREVIARLERCRCVVRLGIGYDSVDVALVPLDRHHAGHLAESGGGVP
jgi:phosphoglycerate dehydrogenase-like enzyme